MFQTGQVTTKGLTVCLVRQLWFYYCFGTSFWKTDWHGITIIYVYVCSLQTAHRLFFKKFFCGCLKKSLFQISYLISHIEDMIQDCLFFLGTKRKGGKFQHKIVFLRIYSMRTKFLLKLWQNKKGRMFVSHACQNDVFFSAASCKFLGAWQTNIRPFLFH